MHFYDQIIARMFKIGFSYPCRIKINEAIQSPFVQIVECEKRCKTLGYDGMFLFLYAKRQQKRLAMVSSQSWRYKPTLKRTFSSNVG